MPEKERKAVERAVLDYVEGAYNVDPSLIKRSVHPRLAKLGFIQENGQYVEHLMTFEELVEIAETFSKDGQRQDRGVVGHRLRAPGQVRRQVDDRKRAVADVPCR